MRVDYAPGDIRQALERLPVGAGDILFCHSNIGLFGRMQGAVASADVCSALFEAIFERIGTGGTLVVPAFTYSFPRREVFDPQSPIHAMGSFSEWVRRQPGALRSLDPCYSVVAIGAAAAALTQDVGENAFDGDSFFGRFHRLGGKVLNMNFDAGSTYIHYVERELKVPYRFDKAFEGVVRLAGELRSRRSVIWVRYLSDDALEADFEPFDRLAREQGLYVTTGLGRGALGVISASDTFRLIEHTLPKRPWFLTKAESLGVTHPVIEMEPPRATDQQDTQP